MSARGGCKPVPLQGGEVVLAEEGYLRDSILLPAKQIVGGSTWILDLGCWMLNLLDR